MIQWHWLGVRNTQSCIVNNFENIGQQIISYTNPVSWITADVPLASGYGLISTSSHHPEEISNAVVLFTKNHPMIPLVALVYEPSDQQEDIRIAWPSIAGVLIDDHNIDASVQIRSTMNQAVYISFVEWMLSKIPDNISLLAKSYLSIAIRSIAEARNVQQMATVFGLSARQITRILQAEIGISPSDIQRHIRNLMAARLLLNPARSIHSVARQLGVSDKTVLWRSLKRDGYEGFLRQRPIEVFLQKTEQFQRVLEKGAARTPVPTRT